jgi:hypothetical protein
MDISLNFFHEANAYNVTEASFIQYYKLRLSIAVLATGTHQLCRVAALTQVYLGFLERNALMLLLQNRSQRNSDANSSFIVILPFDAIYTIHKLIKYPKYKAGASQRKSWIFDYVMVFDNE